MKLIVILIFILSSTSINYGQRSQTINSELKKQIQKTKGEKQYKLIIENRRKIDLANRIDSISFTEMILIEKYNIESKKYSVEEYYINDLISQDTIYFIDGVKYNYGVYDSIEKIDFSKLTKEKNLSIKYLIM